MSPTHAHKAAGDPHVLAQSRLAARRVRVRRIRRRVAACAVIAFMAIWSVVFVRLVAGHDPALAASAGRSTHKAAAASTQTTSGTSSSSGSSSSPSAVTTNQS